jgi:hypothetical protein
MPDFLQYAMIHRRRPDDDVIDDDNDEDGSLTSWRTEHGFQELHRLLSDLAVNAFPRLTPVILRWRMPSLALLWRLVVLIMSGIVCYIRYGDSRSDPILDRFAFQ